MIDLSSIYNSTANVIKEFYYDRVDINRRVKSIMSDGSVSYSLPTEPIIPQIPCSISYRTIDNPDSNDVAKNPLVSVLLIFIDNSIDVRKGDTITAYKYNANRDVILGKYEGICNEPIKYPTHQQIEIILRGNA